MMRTSVTLQQEKATHFESPSILFIDFKEIPIIIHYSIVPKQATSWLPPLKTNIILNLASQ